MILVSQALVSEASEQAQRAGLDASEKYLAEHLNTIEALRAHPEMQSFLEFLAEKPPRFDVRVRRNTEKR